MLAVFQSCVSLHSHQQFMGILVALHPYQNLLLSVFSILALQMDAYLCLNLFSIFNSLMIDDAE